MELEKHYCKIMSILCRLKVREYGVNTECNCKCVRGRLDSQVLAELLAVNLSLKCQPSKHEVDPTTVTSLSRLGCAPPVGKGWRLFSYH